MKSRLPWILFAISLVVNIFAVGGAIYAKSKFDNLWGPPEKRIAHLAKEMNLSEAEKAGLIELRAKIMVRRETRDTEEGGLRDTILAELSRPDFDGERMRSRLSARSTQWYDFMVATVGDIHVYLWQLPEEKRQMFLKRAEDRFFLRGLFGPERSERRRGS